MQFEDLHRIHLLKKFSFELGRQMKNCLLSICDQIHIF
jgi:hypothetical protein